MNNKLLALGLLLAFAALSLPGTANHIIDCDNLDPTGDNGDDNDGVSAPGCDESQATDPTTWGNKVGVVFPVGDDNLCPAGTQPPCPTTSTSQICMPVAGAIGTVTGNLGPPVPANLQAIAILAGTIVYDVVCPNGYVLGWNQGDTAFGITTCENNGSDPDPVTGEPGTPSRQGRGGLCFMSAGWAGATCAFNNPTANADGDSNGNFQDYVGACQAEPYSPRDVIPDASVAREYYKFKMTDSGLLPIDWTSQIADTSCAPMKYTYVDNQWLYMEDSGHVTGFPTADPGATGDVGSYTVSYHGTSYTVGAGDVTCDSPSPWYQSNT